MDLPFVHTISAHEGRVNTEDGSGRKKPRKSKLSDQQAAASQMSWGEVTLFSGCRDDQTSSDARSLGKMAQGAMCFSWLKTLQTAQGVLTYYQVLSSMRTILKKEGFEQIPQLSTGRPIDLNMPFTF
jgi:metacaspase-1